MSISVEVADDGGFRINLSTGMFGTQRKVAESVDSLIEKVEGFLRSQLKEKSEK